MTRIHATFDGHVLTPEEPSALEPNRRYVLTVEDAPVGAQRMGRSQLDVQYIERLKEELRETESASTLAEVRARLAKIPGSMAAEIVAERGER
jgi:hypothetical protein